MGPYFEESLSIFIRNSGDVPSTLRTVAGRYIGENPPLAPVFRIASAQGILRTPDYRYRFDWAERFPDAPMFSVVTAWACLHTETARPVPLAASMGGPFRVFVNGTLIFQSHIGHERTPAQKHQFEAKLNPGRNTFVLEFVKTPRGFGGIFGTANKKSSAIHFLCPSADRDGAEGWLFTEPRPGPLATPPVAGDTEASTGVAWWPARAWTEAQRALGLGQRLWGLRPGRVMRSWTRGDFRQQTGAKYQVTGSSSGPLVVWLGHRELLRTHGAGAFSQNLEVSWGLHDLVVESQCSSGAWDYEVRIDGPLGPVELVAPAVVRGGDARWLHAGPFAEFLPGGPAEFTQLHRLAATVDGPSYFRVDAPDSFLRPFMESGNFGQWHYPQGVNLYGLLVAGRVLESADIETYAQQHLQLVVDWYSYALWDGKTYGAASLLHHLFQMDCLDDCGSAGSALLEAAFRVGLHDFRPLADDIAHYIRQKQERLPDGAFYRNKVDNPFMAGTLWSDDLYMCVPFLSRYGRVSGDETCLTEAVHQFRRYRDYLFLPERQVMCHVYDVTANLANQVPWGRGNGWVIFSLAELLTELPLDHPDRSEMVEFFNTLAEGYLALQDEVGFWHQVLTDPTSYPEASCTSMFLFSFARGLRLGWLPETGYGQAVHRAWGALCRSAVDHRGSVYGVCRGSGFSFTETYYRNDLNWILNDLHGIGILLLAGAEYLHLEQVRREGLLDGY